MTTIAFVNRKGGVAKTTTAVNIAAALGTRGKRGLLIHLDAGAYACSHLSAVDPETSIADVLLGTTTLSEIIVPTSAIGVDLAPSNASLASPPCPSPASWARNFACYALRAFRKEQQAGPKDERYDAPGARRDRGSGSPWTGRSRRLARQGHSPTSAESHSLNLRRVSATIFRSSSCDVTAA